ncbi:hypothetical protein AAFF_G00283040 [Aldrovandia affinis]|uniref:Uncharacterized protein n=1 Tax=Aldrovandia affinis TaxID=143900 RepID=A0AAD7T9X5_9TELE|nr:hypothetical protein AAFF_G00283040 [Aldrovandia affinis]
MTPRLCIFDPTSAQLKEMTGTFFHGSRRPFTEAAAPSPPLIEMRAVWGCLTNSTGESEDEFGLIRSRTRDNKRVASQITGLILTLWHCSLPGTAEPPGAPSNSGPCGGWHS